jgi:LysR family hydrogen peroxide-inducible transcriptional activator
VQAELDALAADVASVAGHIAGGVRLGVIGTTARWLVPPLLDVLGAEHERIALVVVDATTTSLVPQVTEGRLDLAVVNLAVTDPDAEAEPLFDEDRLLVVPADHPLAAREGDSIGVADLAELELLLEPKGTAFRDGLDADAARAGVALRPLAEMDGMQLVSALAFEGYGPAILPATAVPAGSDGRWRKIEVAGITPRSVGLVTRRRAALSTPAGAVREVLHRVVAREAAGRAGLRVTGAPRP